jgi:hypothetical protein
LTEPGKFSSVKIDFPRTLCSYSQFFATVTDEEDLPAEQSPPKAHARVPRAHGNGWWTPGAEASPGQRA